MNAQFKKGVVELCVLKILKRQPMSTFELLEKIKKPLQVTENTLYPLLRRLKKEGYLVNESINLGKGAPRKYFTVTDKGKEKLDKEYQDWIDFVEVVNMTMEGEYE